MDFPLAGQPQTDRLENKTFILVREHFPTNVISLAKEMLNEDQPMAAGGGGVSNYFGLHE